MIWDDEWKSPLTSKNLSNCNAQGLVEKSPKTAILPSIWLSPLTRLKVVLPPGEHSLGHQQLTVWLIICQIALHRVWWLKSPSRGISGFQDRRSCRGASCLNMLVKKFDWLCHAPYLLLGAAILRAVFHPNSSFQRAAHWLWGGSWKYSKKAVEL